MKEIFALLCLLCPSLFGASPFTIEEFNTQANSDSWSVYDYQSQNIGNPDWNAVTGAGNPQASSAFTENNGISIFADQDSSFGFFTGNYLEAGIQGIDCDVYAENADMIASVEFYFLHDGVYYYSDPFTLGSDGWSILQYSFTTEAWSYIDENNLYVEEVVTDEMLSEITEVGVDFFPVSSAAIGTRVGVDYFHLTGQVPTPPLSIATAPEDEIRLSFMQDEDFYYTIESNNDLSSDEWNNLSPETTDIEGTGTFQTTITRSIRQFFRLMTSPILYVVSDIEM